MTTPARENQPVSFDEAQRIIGSEPGHETTPDQAELVAPEHRGRVVEEVDTATLEAAPEDALGGYVPDGSEIKVLPDFGAFDAPAATEETIRGERVQVTPLYVFPPENRQVLTDTSYPWRCGGLVTTSDGEAGSGVLVGARVLLTAKHLRPDRSIAAGSWWVKFVPHAFDGAEPFGSSFVSDLRAPSNGGTYFDYMVCRLYEPLGQNIGFMGVQEWDDDWDDVSHFATIGYPASLGGQRPFFETAVAANEYDTSGDGTIATTHADLTPGNSGGPFWTFIQAGGGLDPRVTAVVAAQATVDGRPDNLLSSGDAMERITNSARRDWPL